VGENIFPVLEPNRVIFRALKWAMPVRYSNDMEPGVAIFVALLSEFIFGLVIGGMFYRLGKSVALQRDILNELRVINASISALPKSEKPLVRSEPSSQSTEQASTDTQPTRVSFGQKDSLGRTW
jgi:hypothetical protein